MPHSVSVVRRVPAPTDAVRAALPEPGSLAWTESTAVVRDVAVEAVLEPAHDATALTLHARFAVHVPYWGFLLDPLFRRALRRHLRRAAEAIEARATGASQPTMPGPPPWAPPEPMDSDQVGVVATLCLLLAVTAYGGSLLTHTIDFVARTYDASNADLGVLTAVSRVGTLLALAGSALSDRWGRRRVLLAALGLLSVATALSAVAPGLIAFGALQVIVRGALNLATVVAFIALTEEAPEGSRAYTLAIAGLATSAGFALGAVLLPAADLHPDAWRALYALGGAGLLFAPGISRRLPETRRYAALARAGVPRGRPRQLLNRAFGGRFAVLIAAGFLLNVFFAPSSQFTNRYLADERGFSGFGILLLRGTTQVVPPLVALWAGGRMAESRGRRPVGITGVYAMAAATAAFFMLGGPALWFMLMLSTSATAFAGPSLSAFNTELFPTQARGTAGAGLLAGGVSGSAVGLLLVGWLAGPLGSIGTAIAVTAVGPIIVATLLLPRLPEARGRLLDDISPPGS